MRPEKEKPRCSLKKRRNRNRVQRLVARTFFLTFNKDEEKGFPMASFKQYSNTNYRR